MENLAIWSIQPDWTNGITESLEWLTSITISATGKEQRRGLRYMPRKMIEYNYILSGPERTYFDLLNLKSAGSPVYVPMWYESCITTDVTGAGEFVLSCDTTDTEFYNIEAVLIWRGKPWDALGFAVTEVAADYVAIAYPVGVQLPKGTHLYALRKCRVESQARSSHRTHLVMSATVRFETMDTVVPLIATEGLASYLNHYVLETNPNEAEDLSYEYQRLNTVLDNKTGVPELYDVFGYINQQFHWWAKGRSNQYILRNLFYVLSGRRVPIWVPTFYRDLEFLEIIGTNVKIAYCGYTDMGGGPAREHIVIETRSIGRLYRRIKSSVVAGENEYEVIQLDSPLHDLEISDIRRVSFLALSRLDQDTVELVHHTETRGMTTATTVFRAAPDELGDAVYFDAYGSAVYMLPNGFDALLPDTRKFTMSMWVKRIGLDGGGGLGSGMTALVNDQTGLTVSDFCWLVPDPQYPGYWYPRGGFTGSMLWDQDSSGEVQGFMPYRGNGDWYNILIAVDLDSDPVAVVMCINDEVYVQNPDWSSYYTTFFFSQWGFSIGNIMPPLGTHYDWGEGFVGNELGHTNRGYLTEFWFEPDVYIDFNDQVNRDKFHKLEDGVFRPVYLGENGEVPLDEPPAIYLHGNESEFTTNRGWAGGIFTVLGQMNTAPEGLHTTSTPVRTRGGVRFFRDNNYGVYVSHWEYPPDTTEFLFSFWLRMYEPMPVNDLGVPYMLFLQNASGYRLWIVITPEGLFNVEVGTIDISNGNPTRLMDIVTTTNAVPADGNWHHIIIGFSTENLNAQVFVDRQPAVVEVTQPLGSGPFIMKNLAYWTVLGIAAGGGAAPAGEWPTYFGDIAEVFVDLTTSLINLDSFCTSAIRSVDLGVDGSFPLGRPPNGLYFSQQPANYTGLTFGIDWASGNNGCWSVSPGVPARPCETAPPPYP